MKILNVLYNFDLFSTAHEFYIQDNNTRFSTKSGRIYSIFIIVMTLSYGIWKTYQWQTVKLQPTITNYHAKGEIQAIRVNQLSFRLSNSHTEIFYPINSTLNTKKDLIFMPQVVSDNKMVPLSPNCGNNSNKYYSFCIQDDLELEILNQNPAQTTLYLFRCNETKLKQSKVYEGYSCAKDKNEIDYYLNNSLFYLTFDIQYYNFIKGQIDNIEQNMDLYIRSDSLYLSLFQIQIQSLTINKGFIPGFSQEKFQIVSGFVASQIWPAERILKYIAKDSYGFIQLGYLSNIQHMSIEYVEFFEILSVIFSFFKIFTVVGNIMIKPRALNQLQKHLEDHLVNQITITKRENLLEGNFQPNNIKQLQIQITKISIMLQKLIPKGQTSWVMQNFTSEEDFFELDLRQNEIFF